MSTDRKFKSNVLKELDSRGFLYQSTDFETLDEKLVSGEVLKFYIGFDATAKSLHVGHLLWIILVERLQKFGLKPIVIAGGGTSKIGDPTWKDTQRAMLPYEDILENIKAIQTILEKLINFTNGKNRAILLNNDDWISNIKYIEFLRDYGPHFSVNKMLAMDSVKNRLEMQHHLSFLEFNYSLLQAYDFLHLYRTHGCTIQLGGADQWSNIISGVDLIRRKENAQVFGLTLPLLTTSDGKKMGKTANGAVWLNPELTSPFDFWQYWRNVDDKDVLKFLKLFSNLSVDEISEMKKWEGSSDINKAKIILADSVTSFVHGADVLENIHKTAESVFIKKDMSNVAKEINISVGTPIDKCLIEAGLAKSLSDARRLITGNSVKLDGGFVTSIKFEITTDCVLSVGKKNVVKIVVR